MNNKILLQTVFFVAILIGNISVIGQNGLSFDGTNDRVDCGNYTNIQISGSQITLEAWVKPTSFGVNNWSNNIIDKEVWSPQQGYMLRCGDGGKVNFNIGSGLGWNEITTTNVVLTVNTWSHVAATYDGSYMRILINGVVVDSIAKIITINPAVSSNLIIGDNSQNGRFFHGLIDEVRIWNIARTAAQIQASMNTELCGGVSGLKLYYRLNQGIASGNNIGITSVINSAASSTNGTMTGFALSGTTSNWVLGKTLTPTLNFGGDSLYATICQGGSYQFGSQNLTTQGVYLENFMTANGCDSIITLFLTVNPSDVVILKDTICQGEVYNLGTQSITQAGTYTETFQNIFQCDSVVHLTLAVKKVTLSLTVLSGGTVIQSYATPASYQWIDCNDNNAIIPGATAQSYAPSTNGSYAVIVTQENCSDTTVCIPITQIVGINSVEAMAQVSIQPNPSTGNFTVDGFMEKAKLNIVIYNNVGTKILEQKRAGGSFKIDLSEFTNGVYFLQILGDGKIYRHKLIKQ